MVLVVLLVFFATQLDGSDEPKFAVLLPGLVVVGSICLVFVRTEGVQRKSSYLSALVAVVAVLIAIVPVADSLRYPDLWSGFGLGPTAVSITATCLVLFLRRFRMSKILEWRFVGIASVLFTSVLAAYLPVFIQPPYGLLNLGDTTYHVLDEILAPLTGKVPYFNYSPQYTMIFGFLLFPLRIFAFDSDVQMNVIIIFCNLCIILVPICVVKTIRRLNPRVSRSLVATVFVALWCVSGPYNGSSIALKEFSNFGRFLPLVFSVYVLTICLGLESRQSLRKHGVLLGVTLGLATLNNPEMGLLMLLAILVSLSVAFRRFQDLRTLFWCATIFHFLVIFVYVFIGILLIPPFRIESVIGIRLDPGIVYSYVQLSSFGPHLLVFSVGAISLVWGLKQLILANPLRTQVQFSIIEISLGLVILGLTFKFLQRPIPENIPQIVVPVILAGLVLYADLKSTQQELIDLRMRKIPLVLPCLMIAFLPFGALLQMPYPKDELRRITNDFGGQTDWSSTPGRPADGWSRSHLNLSYENLIDEVNNFADDYQKSDVVYWGLHGNTVELLTGVKNGLGIAAPESLRFGRFQTELACIPIVQSQPDAVIVYRSVFPCSGYHLSRLKELNGFEVWKRFQINSHVLLNR